MMVKGRIFAAVVVVILTVAPDRAVCANFRSLGFGPEAPGQGAYVTSHAYGVSDDGINPDGQTEGWVVDLVPEPSVAALLTAGAGLLVRRRRTSR